MQDEDAAFERIRYMLLELIEQAQSAVTQTKKVSGRVITDIDGIYLRRAVGKHTVLTV